MLSWAGFHSDGGVRKRLFVNRKAFSDRKLLECLVESVSPTLCICDFPLHNLPCAPLILSNAPIERTNIAVRLPILTRLKDQPKVKTSIPIHKRTATIPASFTATKRDPLSKFRGELAHSRLIHDILREIPRGPASGDYHPGSNTGSKSSDVGCSNLLTKALIWKSCLVAIFWGVSVDLLGILGRWGSVRARENDGLGSWELCLGGLIAKVEVGRMRERGKGAGAGKTQLGFKRVTCGIMIGFVGWGGYLGRRVLVGCSRPR